MYLVYGLQKSGISVARLLEKQNADYRIWDDNKIIRTKLRNIFNDNLFVKPNKNNLFKFDDIFVSPGISLRQNKFKKYKRPKRFKRDLNLYYTNISNQKIIAITGTNGKSTSTKLIGDLLKKLKLKTFVGGNIGEPLCNVFLSKGFFEYHVIELSSFQLETIENLDTKISIITNLSSDHLDRYNNLNDYINQKKNIITNNGINLISLDDKYSKKIFFNEKTIKKISFSIRDKNANVSMIEDVILDNYFSINKKLKIKKISKDLEGNFNNQNILILYICSKILKLPEKYFLSLIKNFKGLPHRSKIVFENKKLKIINNSKSTNLNSTINSIINYNKIYLILGGIAKEKNFNLLVKFKNKIKCIYVYGKSANMIKKKIYPRLDVKKFDKLDLVVKQIFEDIKFNNFKSTILFAPACSSYDQFLNFEERGDKFNKLIQKQLNKL